PPGAAAINTAPASATGIGTRTPTPHHDQKAQQQLSTAAVTELTTRTVVTAQCLAEVTVQGYVTAHQNWHEGVQG
ncbi:hypothetical protein, partial [Streptomyces sp. NPDC002758]